MKAKDKIVPKSRYCTSRLMIDIPLKDVSCSKAFTVSMNKYMTNKTKHSCWKIYQVFINVSQILWLLELYISTLRLDNGNTWLSPLPKITSWPFRSEKSSHFRKLTSQQLLLNTKHPFATKTTTKSLCQI